MRFLLSLTLVAQLLAGPLMFSEAYAGNGDNGRGVPKISLTSEEFEGKNNSKVKVEVETVLPRTSADYTQMNRLAAKELANHPEASRQVILASAENTDVASASEMREQANEVLDEASRRSTRTGTEIEVLQETVPETHVEESKRRFQGMRDFFYKHNRISLTVLRTTVNGTVVAVGLVLNAGLPLATALPIAIVAGGMSGAVQYFNAEFQRLIDGDPAKNKRIIESGRFGRLRVKTTQLVKWFVTEVAIYAVLNGVKAAAGAPMHGLFAETVNVLKSSLMATASQGVWDATLAENTREELRRNEGNTAAQSKVQFRSNVIAFGVSMASVFGGVLSLAGSSLGAWSLGALGVGGLIYAFRSWRNRAGRTAGDAIFRPNFMAANCRSVFN